MQPLIRLSELLKIILKRQYVFCESTQVVLMATYIEASVLSSGIGLLNGLQRLNWVNWDYSLLFH